MPRSDDTHWPLRFDEADPLHAELLRYLRAVRKRGRYSPVRRILTRWASTGYLLELGRLPGGGATDAHQIFQALAAEGLLASHATPELLTAALGALRPAAAPSRPRLDLVEVQREIAAISAAAEHLDFE